MKPRDRVILSLNRQKPDRCPMQISFTPEFAQRLRENMRLSRPFRPQSSRRRQHIRTGARAGPGPAAHLGRLGKLLLCQRALRRRRGQLYRRVGHRLEELSLRNPLRQRLLYRYRRPSACRPRAHSTLTARPTRIARTLSRSRASDRRPQKRILYRRRNRNHHL